MQRFHLLAAVLAAGAFSAAPAAARHQCQPFEELRLSLEQNATDGDAEVVLFVKGGDEGLSQLEVVSPHGRKLVQVHASRRGVGLREFLLESAEPPDFDRVLRSFPEGRYAIRGRTVTGECLRGSAELSHAFAPATTLLAPLEDEMVPSGPLTLEWAAMPEAVRYVVELENEDHGDKFTFEVGAETTSLTLPAELILPDSEYQYGVFVETEAGNLTAVELSFRSAP